MAEEKKKSSWEIPPPGPGTMSGFFLAWAFVAGIIGLTLILMGIGKGPMPLRLVAYDISVEGKTPAEVDLEKLTSAINQTNAMILALQGTSKDLTEELARKLEVKEENVASDLSSAILSKYSIEKFEGARLALVQYGKIGKFGVINVELREPAGGGDSSDLQDAVDLAREEFGKTPHAIFVLASGEGPGAPSGYLDAFQVMVKRGKADTEKRAATDWRVFIPEAIKDNLKECYVPADNEKVKEFSDRLPVVTRFVFRKKDFD